MLQRNRLRALLQSAWLNPVTTGLCDRLNPLESLGAMGEREAERFLLRHGYMILFRSFTNQFGEIDLIVSDGESVVFVEVKTRSSDFAGRPDEAVDDHKQAQISRIAVAFLRQNELLDSPARFDVISVDWDQQRAKIRHFENAFELVCDYQII